MKRLITLTFALTASLALAGCNNDKKADASGAASATASSATMCVACGQPAGDKPVLVSYKGKNVPMCCEACAKKFNAMTDKDKDAKIASAAKK